MWRSSKGLITPPTDSPTSHHKPENLLYHTVHALIDERTTDCVTRTCQRFRYDNTKVQTEL
jgi:hypothetical protein